MSRSERGAATLFALGGLLLLSMLAMLLAVVGGTLVTHRRAQSAADLAALAGAAAIQHGRDGCSSATRTAAGNGAELDSCEADGGYVTVRASIETPRMFGRRLVVRAEARAGPG